MRQRRDKLAARRRAVGHSQESLAEHLGLGSPTTVARWEQGISTPQPWQRPKLAAALGRDLDELDELLIPGPEPDDPTSSNRPTGGETTTASDSLADTIGSRLPGTPATDEATMAAAPREQTLPPAGSEGEGEGVDGLETWDELDWDEDDPDPPDRVEADAINKWLFNADTVLEHLMTRGVKVAGGDRLGKTIIFAKDQAHADFIADRFDVNYPHLRGRFARVITHKTEFGQSLIDQFSIKEGAPHIAVSVDMLDTGIDIPEVVNLVFFKIVRSKTKFWQMLGRGTRLCPDLFGPGDDKQFFQVFDYCQNFEFFNQNPEATEATEATVAPSLGARLITNRLDLVGTLQDQGIHDDVRRAAVDLLWQGVAAINLDNFVARPHRRLVERFKDHDAWTPLGVDDQSALAQSIADLPTELPAEPEEAKRFDLLMLHLELSLVRAEPGYPHFRNQVKRIAGLIEEYPSIPAVAEELELIADLQTDEWWDGVTLPMLESVRRRLRGLVAFIEKRKRKIVYTDFEDEIGEHVEIDFGGLAPASELERFRRKATAFLREHRGEIAVEKVHKNWPITAADMEELQRILVASGAGTPDDIDDARAEAGSFGLFVRSLVGLDRSAAKTAFATSSTISPTTPARSSSST